MKDLYMPGSKRSSSQRPPGASDNNPDLLKGNGEEERKSFVGADPATNGQKEIRVSRRRSSMAAPVDRGEAPTPDLGANPLAEQHAKRLKKKMNSSRISVTEQSGKLPPRAGRKNQADTDMTVSAKGKDIGQAAHLPQSLQSQSNHDESTADNATVGSASMMPPKPPQPYKLHQF